MGGVEGEVGGVDGLRPLLGVVHEAAPDAGVPRVFIDHDFLDPGDGAVGEESEMAVGQ